MVKCPFLFKKIYFVCFLTVVFTVQAASCILPEREYRPDPAVQPVFQAPAGKGLAQAQLDDREAALYEIIDTALRTYTEAISGGLEAYSDETIVKVYGYVLNDHPEYFWLQDGYLLKSSSGLLRRKKVLEPLYAMATETVEGRQDRMEAVRDEILETLRPMKTDYEKLLYIHDFLVRTVQYDTAAYTDIDTQNPTARSRESTTAYGALVNRQALCGGYTKAFQYLAEAAGIRCATVSGHKKGAEAHVWNLVLLDGEGYYVDVTWDDPVSAADGTESGAEREIFYNYFCITEEELLRTHVIDGEQNIALPVCNAVQYNYFHYHDAYLAVYTLDGAAAILERAAAAARKTAYIKFDSAAAMDQAIQELFTQKEIFGILADAGCETESASYSRDPEHFILTVNFGYV